MTELSFVLSHRASLKAWGSSDQLTFDQLIYLEAPPFYNKIFKYINNTRIINILKLLNKMKNFIINYNWIKSYSNFEIPKWKNLTNNNGNLLFKQYIGFKVLKIVNFKFNLDKIFKLYIENK